jgi:hypothetical protein
VSESFGEKTNTALLLMFLDVYRQEVAAEEDVHRTLPFFATALGLIVAALNYVAGQLPAWAAVRAKCGPSSAPILSWSQLGCIWPSLAAGALLVGAAVLTAAVLVLLARATNRRNYQRNAPEPAH